MICTALNDLYCVELFVLRWITCATLNDLYYVEWFILRLLISTVLRNLCYIEWFVLGWVICTTLNDLNYFAWFVQCWIISTPLNYLYYAQWLVLRWVISTTLNSFYYLEKFLRPRMMFLITLAETIINVFSGHIYQLLEHIWRSTFLHDLLYCTTAPFISKSQGKTKTLSWSTNEKSWKWEISPHQYMDWKNSKFWID